MKAWIERWLGRNAVGIPRDYVRVDLPGGGYRESWSQGRTYRIRKFFGIEFKQLTHYYY